ncbi:MAG: PEP-CTERM sorting domain-containing protein [Acidobacteriota bacterium]
MKNKVLLAMVLAVAIPGILSGTQLCTDFLGQDILGVTECSAGNLVFSNFWAQGTANWPGSINLMTVSTDPGTVKLGFTPNMVLTGPGIMDVWFKFTVTGFHHGIDLAIVSSGGSVNENACATEWDGFNCGQLLASLHASGVQSVDALYGQSVPVAYILKDIFLLGGQQGGHFTIMEQSFLTSNIPEPLTLALIGSGLLGFGLLRRRIAKR